MEKYLEEKNYSVKYDSEVVSGIVAFKLLYNKDKMTEIETGSEIRRFADNCGK